MKCTYSLRDWIGQYTVELLEEFNATRDSFTDTIVYDDGSPIKCNGKVRAKKEPCLELSMSSTFLPFDIDPESDTYYSQVHTAIWFGTWVPDGLAHSYGGYLDLSELQLYLRNLNGTVIRDWDFERDGYPTDPNITFGTFQVANLIVRQAGELYLTPVPGTAGADHISDPDLPALPPTWNRPLTLDEFPYSYGFPWSQATGGPDISGWNHILHDDDPTKPYAYTEIGHPDNAVGAPDWELGLLVSQGVANSPSGGAPAGSPSWEPTSGKGRIDNFCLRIDAPTP